MAKILIIYGTDEGHTLKVAERIAEVIKSAGHTAELLQGNRAPSDFSPSGFDAVIVGTSIHLGVHQISVKRLVRKNRSAFANVPTAFFCVCLTVTSQKPQDQQQVQKYVKDFTGYTGMDPIITAVFAGALKYPYYNFIKRFVIKLVARKLGLDTDTSNVYEYTDWNAVETFAKKFIDLLQKQETNH